ncbi:PEP-CTERM sorting domain-containing protein [Megalodesulfovibrio paquesii]
MSRLTTSFLTALLLISLTAGQAFAAASLPGNDSVSLYFFNWEQVYRTDTTATGQYAVGDIVYGLLNMDSVGSSISGQISGAFLLEVTEIKDSGEVVYGAVSDASSLIGLDTIATGISAVLADLFFSDGATGNNDVMILFDGSSLSKPFSGQAGAMEAFTDGTHFLTYSMLGDDYWYGTGTIDATTNGFLSYYGLSITSYLGSTVDPDFFTLLDSPYDTVGTLHEMVGYTALFLSDKYKGNPNGETNVLSELFPYLSRDPQLLATPEPGTLALLGSGMLALFAARRRRRNQAA